MTDYLLNCFLLFIPVFIWNAVFFKKLPDYYQPAVWDRIPKALDVSENILRYLSFFIPILFRIDFGTGVQVTGLVLYLAGLAVYFTSWVVQMNRKHGRVSKSPVFRMAPAYTTSIWLTGIGLIGRQSPVAHLRTAWFLIMAAFIIVHTYHSYLVYRNTGER